MRRGIAVRSVSLGSPDMTNLSPTEKRVYEFLAVRAGEIVPIAAFGAVICVSDKGCTNLRVVLSKLRRKGIEIETVVGKGYRLKVKQKMPVITHDAQTQQYADELQVALAETMGRHVDSVGFESQLAIIGVVIGSLLDQLPDADKEHYTGIFLQNVRDARKYSQPVRMQ